MSLSQTAENTIPGRITLHFLLLLVAAAAVPPPPPPPVQTERDGKGGKGGGKEFWCPKVHYIQVRGSQFSVVSQNVNQ